MMGRNVVANFVGQVWLAALNLALTPVYLHLLGVEAFGLIGFFASLEAIIVIIDMGLSATANREIALRSNTSYGHQEIRNLVRTLEVVYAAGGLAIAALCFLLSSWIASDWLASQELALDTVRWATIIFGAGLGMRWPVSLYAGVLRGLENQILLNKINIGIATLKHLGALTVILIVSPTLLTYLVWQLVSAIIEISILALAVWRHIPMTSGQRSAFDSRLLQLAWRFSAKLGLISAFAMVLKQLDKVLISKLLPLEQVGYYAVASVVSSGILLLSASFFNAAFPRFTALIANKQWDLLAETYHRSSQFVAFISAPVSGAVTFFSYHILLLWTRSEDVAEGAYLALSVLAFASMFNAPMQISFALQLASGQTWIGLWTNGLATLALAPLMYVLVKHLGIVGAGGAWAIFNVFYYLVVPPVLHRHILPRHSNIWFFEDTLPFIIISSLAFGSASSLLSAISGSLWPYGMLASGFAMYLTLCVCLVRPLRRRLMSLALWPITK